MDKCPVRSDPRPTMDSFRPIYLHAGKQTRSHYDDVYTKKWNGQETKAKTNYSIRCAIDPYRDLLFLLGHKMSLHRGKGGELERN
eukprot:scaffold7962_cov65-Cylindrotheca_fusiformis.AAC.2